MSCIWPINFNKRFAYLVESGVKRQTIRAERKDKRRPEPGDRIHCYFGLRTKHTRLLHEGTITEVTSIMISLKKKQIWVPAGRLAFADDFARQDGFSDFKDMMAWWKKTHPEPEFRGFMIKWNGEL